MAFIVGQRNRGHVVLRTTALLALLVATVVVQRATQAEAQPSDSPPEVPSAVDTNPDPAVFETTIVAQTATRDIGGDVLANMWTYNGTVPGPELRLKVGDTVIVHFRNELPLSSSIHWHGIELNNASDGTSLTQNGVPPGGSFLYKFTVPRPGVFWYHPHHNPTNPVFKGQYGSLIVADPHDDTLVAHGVLPPPERTRTLVLSDTTVCKEPGRNDTDTYDDSLPWAGGGPLPEQRKPFPSDLCDTPVDEQGNPIKDASGRPIPLNKGDIPNIQRFGTATQGRTNEGQTVLANGRNAGGRAGSPEAPGALAADATALGLPAGQGLRLQVVNAATVRHMRLRLTDAEGTQIPLIRVGGEGGLLDNARIEGGLVDSDGIETTAPYDTKYGHGELLLSPSDRVDVVVAVPRDAPIGVATLWTLDYKRTGEDFPAVPTVPVLHMDVTDPTADSYSIAVGAPLRTHPAVDDPVERLGPPPTLLPDTSGEISPLRDPSTFEPPKPGSANEDIRLTTDATGSGPTIDDVEGHHDDPTVDYTAKPHSPSSRYATVGDLLELTVTNATAAHHAFHFHGFSFQPMAFEKLLGPNYIFDYHEFRDTIDIPAGYTLRFRVRLDDRPLMDGATPGGATGRWVLHCHIFFHATHGMHAELVVVGPDGNERPNVNADATSVPVSEGATASATGTFSDPDGDVVALSASEGTVTDLGGGRWAWSGAANAGTGHNRAVYITAVDAQGLRNQAAFGLAVDNIAPTVTITSPPPGTGFALGVPATVMAAVTDPGATDVLSCRFDWDDGTGLGSPVTAVGGACSESRMLPTGVYTVRVVASDGDGGTDTDSTTLAVYDPNGGRVVGRGTIDSPPGAVTANPLGVGPARFDFDARYRTGSSVPTGNTRFTVALAQFDFRATGYEWLVLKAGMSQLRGSGRVNGVDGYRFLLTAVDDNAGPDLFRLKIWDASGAVAYDNVAGAPDDLDTAEPAPITSGDITRRS